MITTNHGRESAAADCLQSLGDDHRRSEAILRQFAIAAEEAAGEELTEAQRTALEVKLQAFQQHRLRRTDEETSLFTRIRGQSGLEIQRVCPKLDLLEEGFWTAQFFAERVVRIGRHWLDQNHLTRSEYAVLCSTLDQLCRLYRRHIQVEEEVFPLAERVLTQAA
jgi:hemerythrin-like domain-containing protein